MKYLIAITCILTSTISFTMKPEIKIKNSDLDTLKKPHITIINELSTKNPSFSTMLIDVSDKTKINTYNNYNADDSTITIYPNQNRQFFPRRNRILKPEHKRAGMNDTSDAALINIYIHSANKNSLNHLVIGQGSCIRFGDTIIVTAHPNGTIFFTNNNDNTISWETHITSDPEKKRRVSLIGIPGPGYIKFQDINSQELSALLRPILKRNYYLGRHLLSEAFLEENPYIKHLLCESGNYDEKEFDPYIKSLLHIPKTENIENIIQNLTDRFNLFLQNNPDFKNDLANMYPLNNLL